jgi:DNA-directed RNA polymerase specialized sigma24 family protein
MARPLTKKDKNGNLYVRPSTIEAKIDAALGQDWSILSERARQTDRRSPNFLPNECLIHLIRDALRRKDERIATVFIKPLLQRCEANLKITISDKALRNAEAIREEAIDALMTMITEDGQRGHEDDLDFFECNFRRAFRALRVNSVREDMKYRRELIQLPEKDDDEGEPSFDADILARLSRMARIDANQEHSLLLDELLEQVRNLPETERKAVILTRILGYEEESVDKSKRTAATICGVTGRTIRYRLAKATRRLKDDGEKE